MNGKNESVIQSKIIHISDLHFGNVNFDTNLWHMVRSNIVRHKPDIIIVSGDIVEAPCNANFKKAKKDLDELKKESGAELILVPGNHDVAIKGNDISFLSLEVFGLLRNLFKRRFKKHFGTYDKQPDNEKILINCFDSTTQSFLASGKVEDKELYELFKVCSESSAQSLRIAVLHHHPLPIPYSESQGLTNFEPFLVMRNAGTFLKQLSDCDFDLVLHGHKHYSNFARITLGLIETKELGVLSVGSSTLKYDTPGRNSYYLISVYKNGNVEIQQYNCGGGQVILEEPKKISLFTIPGRKLRAFRRSAKYQGFEFDTVEHNCEILKDGTSVSTTHYIDMKMHGRIKNGRPVHHEIDKGRILKTALDQSSSNKGFVLKLEEETATTLKGRIDFGPCIMGNKPVSYSIIKKAQASFAMTQEEYRRINPNDPNIFEEISFSVIFPIKTLKLSIKYPQIHNLEMPKPFLCISFSSDLISAPIDNEGELDSPPCLNWIRDGEMEDYEKQGLKIKDGEFIVHIDYPIVGYKYKIKWKLAKISKDIFPCDKAYSQIVGETIAYQHRLLRYRNERHNKNEKTKEIHHLFNQLHEFLKRRYCSLDSETETFSMTLMTYDDAKGSLLIVEGIETVGNKEKELDWEFKLAPGVGNAGMAYKTGVPISYMSDEDVSNYYVTSLETETKYKVLLSIPLYHPNSNKLHEKLSKEIPQHLILPALGILNIGSDSSATKLRMIEEKELITLRPIIEIFFSGILKILTA